MQVTVMFNILLFLLFWGNQSFFSTTDMLLQHPLLELCDKSIQILFAKEGKKVFSNIFQFELPDARSQNTFLLPPPSLPPCMLMLRFLLNFLDKVQYLNQDFGFVVKILGLKYSYNWTGLHAAVTDLMFLCQVFYLLYK